MEMLDLEECGYLTASQLSKQRPATSTDSTALSPRTHHTAVLELLSIITRAAPVIAMKTAPSSLEELKLRCHSGSRCARRLRGALPVLRSVHIAFTN